MSELVSSEVISYYEITEEIKLKLNRIDKIIIDFSKMLKSDEFYEFCNEIRQSYVYSNLVTNNNIMSFSKFKEATKSNNKYEKDKDIIAVKNIKYAYDIASDINIYKLLDLLKLHDIISRDLIEDHGFTRSNQVVSSCEGNRVYFALPPQQVVRRLEKLFDWLIESDEDIIIKACVFYYEFLFIHPFRKFNGIVSRIWFKQILASYNKFFIKLPIEDKLMKNYKKLNSIIIYSRKEGDCTKFIEFILDLIYQATETFSTFYKYQN